MSIMVMAILVGSVTCRSLVKRKWAGHAAMVLVAALVFPLAFSASKMGHAPQPDGQSDRSGDRGHPAGSSYARLLHRQRVACRRHLHGDRDHRHARGAQTSRESPFQYAGDHDRLLWDRANRRPSDGQCPLRQDDVLRCIARHCDRGFAVGWRALLQPGSRTIAGASRLSP